MVIRILYLALALLVLYPVNGFAQNRSTPQSQSQVQLSFAPVVKQVAPAVVNIYTKRVVSRSVHPFANHPFFSDFFRQSPFGGRMRRQVESALGSGVIVDANGIVVTNAHVIDGAQEVTIVLSDGREFPAEVDLIDKPTDLAILKVDNDGEDLPAVNLKSSETLEVGDIVLAIGNPFGVGQTVTSGIVSAQGRSSLDINDFNFFIQTDAAINPGNSGGPLVALDGSVVGINTAIYSRDGGSLGIGFAIPSEMVVAVMAAMKAGTAEQGVIRAWLGIRAQDITADIAGSIGLDKPQGVLVAQLHRASPFYEAGLRQGDVILSIDGRTIRSANELKFRFATVPIGESARVEVLKKGNFATTRVLRVQSVAPPDDPPREETTLQGRHPLNGAVIANVNPAVVAALGLPLDLEEGVVVLRAPQRSRFGGVAREGDILMEINGRKIEDVRDVLRALEKPTNQGWQLTVNSRGQTRRVVVR